jgi:hypothetical protein
VSYIVVSLVIVFVTASEKKFEMSYEMETGTAQIYRCGKRIKKCMLIPKIQIIIPQQTIQFLYNGITVLSLFNSKL